ncbi:hypothetical protein LWS69_07935, partial [Bordetella hinzii]|nr:hypothetical protein [Bordetella hinzii]
MVVRIIKGDADKLVLFQWLEVPQFSGFAGFGTKTIEIVVMRHQLNNHKWRATKTLGRTKAMAEWDKGGASNDATPPAAGGGWVHGGG